jgi:hypothetical protein
VRARNHSCIASKGKAAHLLKGSSKKKRSRRELEEVKDEEELLNKNRQEFLRTYKHLKTNPERDQAAAAQVEKNQQILNKLFSQGLIDKQGNVVAAKRDHSKMQD